MIPVGVRGGVRLHVGFHTWALTQPQGSHAEDANSSIPSGMKEALRHRFIPTVARAAHTGVHPVLTQELPIAIGSILAATVGMHNEARRGLPLTDRHRQCLV